MATTANVQPGFFARRDIFWIHFNGSICGDEANARRTAASISDCAGHVGALHKKSRELDSRLFVLVVQLMQSFSWRSSGYSAITRTNSLPSTAGLVSVKGTLCTSPVVTMTPSEPPSGVQVTRSVEVSTV